MNPSRLWAKSKRDDEPERPSMLLPGHLQDVYTAAGRVLGATADDQLTALGLDPTAYRERFRRVVLLSAAVHDLGKANDHFQGMIRGERKDRPQGLRHEWVTVLLLRGPLRAWLIDRAGGEADAALVEWAVGGHHPAYNRESPPRRADPRGAGTGLTVHAAHADFRASVDWLGETFGGGPAVPAPIAYPLVGGQAVFQQIGDWFRESARRWDTLPPVERKLAAAAKACVIAADVAGSALPERIADDGERDAWIGQAFANRPEPGELAGLVSRRLGGGKLRSFQSTVGASAAPVTLVRAGCGSGKTVAAYHWAATNHPTRRLYFCYPTTGTATEGFKDYLLPADDDEYRLFHGRAGVDLATLTTGGDEPNPAADAAARIESLDAWLAKAVSCTVDTVLGLVQNARRGLYAWPALAGSAFVFDEIHAYDDKLFGALLRFLQTLPGVPVLLMTASLPAARRTALDDCLKRAKLKPLAEIPGAGEVADASEELLRYKLEAMPSDVAARVRQEYADRGKVLWVSNTVNRAMAAAASVGNLKPMVYHSRFRYCDRVDRHKEVVAAFKPDRADPVIACTTQVAEMSLDLKGTTLLVTELAPVPALIQRLGRLNRDATTDDPKPFVVIDVGDDHLPYTAAELASAREWLKALEGRPLSQRDLAAAWQEHDASRKPDFVASAWLDGGPATSVLELREASPGVTVILAADATDVRAGRRKLVEVAIPMPPPKASIWRDWPTLKNTIPIAPAGTITYHPKEGAAWVALKADK